MVSEGVKMNLKDDWKKRLVGGNLMKSSKVRKNLSRRNSY